MAYRRVEVAIGYGGEDGGVDDAQSLHAVHPAATVDDRIRVVGLAEAARAARVVCPHVWGSNTHTVSGSRRGGEVRGESGLQG